RVISVPVHAPSDELQVFFDGADALAEGSYTFHWVSSDQHENKSMVFEKIASVYGALYQEKLLNRRILETIPDDAAQKLTIRWAPGSSEEEIGIELQYTTTGGELKTDRYPRNLVTTLILDDIDFTKGVTYRTLYVPEPAAIDTFYTATTRASIVKITNVARGKPAVSSDNLNATYPAEKAVDGQLGDASRWVSSASGSEHWIEIDLQGEYSINSYAFWNGSSNNYSNNPLASFKLQAWINDAWIDAHASAVPNDGPFSTDFPPVTTTKVRFVTPTQTRIYELEVYSKIVY
ncbi:MAG: discoidin domain-containing protein, partial [Tannerella sp.]|nr:discoidin domain-containing protein [Tannerella sp.]